MRFPVVQRRLVRLLAAVGLLAGFCGRVDADSGQEGKSGIGPGKISLPSGPGSVEGLGSAFEPQLNSGTATYGVSISVPPGVAGLQPNVSLSYNSGSGNSAFGIAWSWEPMKIERQTSKGFPKYSTEDVFELGGEELIELTDGSFRKKNESDFSRVRRVQDGWEVSDREGTRFRLGTTNRSRVHRAGGVTFDETFAWYVDEVIDVHGNRMTYAYDNFEDSKGRIYCREIRYSIFESAAHSVCFDYERRPDSFSSYLSGFEVTTAYRCWQIRVLSRDSLVRRYGLEYEVDDGIETNPECGMKLGFSLLRKVTQYDYRTKTEASYLPPLRFGYSPFDAAKGVRGTLSENPVWSLTNPNLALIDLNCDALPDYLYTDPGTGRHEISWNLGKGRFSDPVEFLACPTGVSLDQPGVELLDLDGDGRSDLVQKAGGAYDHFVWYPNVAGEEGFDESRPCWGEERIVVTPHLPFDLDSSDVRSLDLNGDKRMDYMRTTGAGFVYYFNENGAWREDGLYMFGEEQMGDITYADDVSFADAEGRSKRDVVLADMNGDGLLDLVRWYVFQGRVEIVFWPNCGSGRWGYRTEMRSAVDIGVVPEDNLHVFDLNGDGLSDIVLVDYDRILYWINMGNNGYSDGFEIANMPTYIPGQTVLRQVDVNGNGSTDFLWENWDPAIGGWKREYYDFIGETKPNLLTSIDNGLGVLTEIEYATTTDFYVRDREGGNPWLTRLPFASTVVKRITKHLGVDFDTQPGEDTQIKEMAYRDGYYDTEEREFRGFAFAKSVDRGDDRYQRAGEERVVRSPSRMTRMAFHTGKGDVVLKGKPLWQESTLLTADFDGVDNDGDGWIDEDDEGERGGVFASDAVVFTRSMTDWQVRVLYDEKGSLAYTNSEGLAVAANTHKAATRGKDKKISYAFDRETIETIFEANGRLSVTDRLTPRRSSRRKRTVKEVDCFGNALWTKDYGEDTGRIDGDEIFSFVDYAVNFDQWILGVPVSERKTDASGRFVSATRSYYDGTELWGLAYGKVGSRGLFMRKESAINGAESVPDIPVATDAIGDPRVAPNTWITVERNAYDAYGNIVRTCDAEWHTGVAGHERLLDYDPVFHTYVVGESVVVDAARTFKATATYDYGGGVTLSTMDFNGHTSFAQYDSFYRPVAIVRPGDSTALPTQSFAYRLADPRRHFYYDYAADGRLTIRISDDQRMVQRKAVLQRECALKVGTFDTYMFSDGAGRELGTVREDVDGRWVCSSVNRFTTLGEIALAYQPFFSANAACPEIPEAQPHAENFFDAMGRSVRVINPPEEKGNATRTETRTVYLPFETVSHDEEDLNSESAFYQTPSTALVDGQGRTISTTEILRGNGSDTAVTVTMAYDAAGNAVRLTDAQGNVKIQRHDGLGRRFFVHDPDAGRLISTFDGLGNVVEIEDNAGRKIRFAHDGAGRVLSEKAVSREGVGPDITYEYDFASDDYPAFGNLKGELACVRDDSGAEFFSRDARGRVTSRIKRVRYPSTGQHIDYPFEMTYDSMDRVTALTYPDGDREVFSFGRHSKVDGISNLVEKVLYTESEQLYEIKYANGVRTVYGYDPRLRLKSLTTIGGGSSAGKAIVEYAYKHNGLSNVLSIDDHRNWVEEASGRADTQVFSYDSLSRLTRYRLSDVTTHTFNFGEVNYEYDLIGNMTRKASTSQGSIGHLERFEHGRTVVNLGAMTSGGNAGTFKRMGRNTGDDPGPHALTATEDGRTIRYDDSGNMIELEGMSLTWDYRNRLQSVESADFRAEFTYDYNGTRMTKRVIAKSAAITNSVTVYPDRAFELRNGNEPTKYAIGGVNRLARFTKMLNPSDVCRQWVVLEKGWNFIGLQIAPNVTLRELFDFGGAVDSVSRFNANTGKYADVVADDAVEAGVPYMIHAKENRICEVVGSYVGKDVFTLKVGEQALLLGRSLTVGAFLGGVDARALMASTGTAADGKAEWKTWRENLAGDATFFLWRTRPETSIFVNLNTAATVDLDDLTPENVLYYHFNHLGSTAAMTDRTGALFREMQYLPYGQLRAEYGRNASGGDYGFIGKERDDETGLHYDEARYLAAHLGRFLSVDPLGTDGGANVYGYTNCDPVRNVDQNGLFVAVAALAANPTFWAAAGGAVASLYCYCISVRNINKGDNVNYLKINSGNGGFSFNGNNSHSNNNGNKNKGKIPTSNNKKQDKPMFEYGKERPKGPWMAYENEMKSVGGSEFYNGAETETMSAFVIQEGKGDIESSLNKLKNSFMDKAKSIYRQLPDVQRYEMEMNKCNNWNYDYGGNGDAGCKPFSSTGSTVQM